MDSNDKQNINNNNTTWGSIICKPNEDIKQHRDIIVPHVVTLTTKSDDLNYQDIILNNELEHLRKKYRHYDFNLINLLPHAQGGPYVHAVSIVFTINESLLRYAQSFDKCPLKELTVLDVLRLRSDCIGTECGPPIIIYDLEGPLVTIEYEGSLGNLININTAFVDRICEKMVIGIDSPCLQSGSPKTGMKQYMELYTVKRLTYNHWRNL